MSTSNEGPAAAASQQQQHVSQSRIRRPQRRTFSIGSFRFQCTRQRLIDAIVDGMSTCVEGVVYLIGPLLIALALGIISLLAYTFFFILLPMMNEKYATHPYKTVILGLHCCCVLVLIVNIVFNYAACVLQRHTGPHYDKLVRELACATDFGYPETPAQLAAYRREVSERMVQRFRRRQQHQQAQHGATAAATASASNTAVAVVASSATSASSIGGAELNGDIVGAAEGMTKRRNAVEASAASATPRSVPAPPPQPTIRSWMLMGPFEWGYCSSTNQPKPPRSHYDHVSRSLVLNLDHYCPWMFNASKCIDVSMRFFGTSIKCIFSSFLPLFLYSSSRIFQLPLLSQCANLCLCRFILRRITLTGTVFATKVTPFSRPNCTATSRSSKAGAIHCGIPSHAHDAPERRTNAIDAIIHALCRRRCGCLHVGRLSCVLDVYGANNH